MINATLNGIPKPAQSHVELTDVGQSVDSLIPKAEADRRENCTLISAKNSRIQQSASITM